MFNILKIGKFDLRAATYYIPFCPRYIQPFNYPKFRDAVISECNRLGKREDHANIATNVAKLHNYNDMSIYTRINFPGADLSQIHSHLGPGLIGRIAIITGMITAITAGDLVWVILDTSIYSIGAMAIAEATQDSHLRSDVDNCIWHLNQILYHKRSENNEKDLILKKLNLP